MCLLWDLRVSTFEHLLSVPGNGFQSFIFCENVPQWYMIMQMHDAWNKTCITESVCAVLSCSEFKVLLTLCQHSENAQWSFCSKFAYELGCFLFGLILAV